jgi:hypothetical protein
VISNAGSVDFCDFALAYGRIGMRSIVSDTTTTLFSFFCWRNMHYFILILSNFANNCSQIECGRLATLTAH